MNLKNKNAERMFSSSILPIIFSILIRIYYHKIYLYSAYIDTGTYFDAGINFLNGRIDMMRTPVYPLFLQACLRLFPDSISTKIPILQSIIFVLSIFFFHKICTHFIKNKYIIFFTCLFYGCIPSIASWEFCALTETFSIISIVVFVYFIVLYLEQKAHKYLIITSFFMFIMVMLKPGFIFVYIIFLGFLVLNFILTKVERKKMIMGFISTLISLSLVFTYAQINKIQNHVNGISIVTDINNFFNVVLSGIYQHSSDTEIVEAVDNLIRNGTDPARAAYEVELEYRSYYPVNRIGNFNKEVKQKYKKEYLSYTKEKFTNVYGLLVNAKYAALSEGYHISKPVTDIFDLNINFFCIYFLLIIEILIISLAWIGERRPPWGNIGIFFILLLQVIVAIVGAQGEFARLIVPILPIIIILIFKNIDILVIATYKRREEANLDDKAATIFEKEAPKCKTAIIVGAGPAGLTCAYELLKNTDIKPIILEETYEIGGISKTVNYKGNGIDIGGHRFFSKNDYVMNFWKTIMPIQGSPAKDDLILFRNKELNEGGPNPEETDRVMLLRNRISRILYLRKFFDYPISLKFRTLANLGLYRTVVAGFGYISSAIFKRKEEKTLEDFMINRFGKPLYEMFFEDYNKKVWGVSPAQMSPDWGSQRIKGLSLMKAVKNMFTSAFGTKNKSEIETSLIEEFLYPKKGPGQLWETVALEILNMGGEIKKGYKVTSVNNDKNKITSVIADTQYGSQEINGDYFISTMPIKDLFESFSNKNLVPKSSYDIAINLPYRDFITVGLLVDKLKLKNKTNIKTVKNIVPDCWIYIQERDVKIGRLQIFNNWSPYMVKDFVNTVWIGLEYFCQEGDSMWNMSDKEFIDFAISELVKIDIIDAEDVKDALRIKVKKAYPGYFGVYNKFGEVKNYLDTLENLYCIGRNGQHRYNNMDHSMLTALECVNNIKDNMPNKDNIWNVNTEQEYHESKANN